MGKKNIQGVFSVTRKEYLTPHYIRVFLTGDAVTLIENTTVGTNNKILIPPPGLNQVHFPEYDQQKRRWIPLPKEVSPSIRTYTHRAIDLEKNEIRIDFVAHGDKSPASAWAINAKPGDVLGVLMRDGKSQLYKDAANYLLIGDATAIPVFGAILESLPGGVKATCMIEVHGKSDEQIFATMADAQIIWLHNENPHLGSLLADTTKEMDLPSENRFAYVAAEYSTVKAIRQHLRNDCGWLRTELDAYSYWKIGASEDNSAEERHDESQS